MVLRICAFAAVLAVAEPIAAQSADADAFRAQWGVLTDMAGKDFGARYAGAYAGAKFRWIVPGEKLLLQINGAGECLYARNPSPALIHVTCRIYGETYDHPRNSIERLPDNSIREIFYINDPLWGTQGNKGGYKPDKEPGTYVWKKFFGAYDYHFVPVERLGPEGAGVRQVLAAMPEPQSVANASQGRPNPAPTPTVAPQTEADVLPPM